VSWETSISSGLVIIRLSPSNCFSYTRRSMASSPPPRIKLPGSALAIIQKVVTELKRPAAAPTARTPDTQAAPSDSSFGTAASSPPLATTLTLEKEAGSKEVKTSPSLDDQHENEVSTPKVSSAPKPSSKLEDKKLLSRQLSTIPASCGSQTSRARLRCHRQLIYQLSIRNRSRGLHPQLSPSSKPRNRQRYRQHLQKLRPRTKIRRTS
jgi:hypothetical protein